MKCEYCELRRVGPFVISKACHMTSPDPCMNNGINCPIRKATTKKVAR